MSADLTHKTRASVVTLTVFHTQIDNPRSIDRATYTLRTEAEPVVTRASRSSARRAGRRSP